jgi:hypothetical protein
VDVTKLSLRDSHYLMVRIFFLFALSVVPMTVLAQETIGESNPTPIDATPPVQTEPIPEPPAPASVPVGDDSASRAVPLETNTDTTAREF